MKDRMKGKAKDIKGRVKRQAGEWTGSQRLQGEGAAEQAEGKLQSAWGEVKEGAEDIAEELRGESGEARREVERKRPRRAA